MILQARGLFQILTLEGWDIIGWDVRSVGSTRSLLTCFPDEAARKACEDSAPKSTRRSFNHDPLIALDENIRQNLNHYEDLVKACKTRAGSFLPYIDTPNNARDLYTIIKAIKAVGGKGKLAYWGYQYATLTGETFAGLYPNVLDYLILDSIVRGEKAYVFGDTETFAIQDAHQSALSKIREGLTCKVSTGARTRGIHYGFLHFIISFASQ